MDISDRPGDSKTTDQAAQFLTAAFRAGGIYRGRNRSNEYTSSRATYFTLEIVNGHLILNGYTTNFYFIYAGAGIVGFMFAIGNTVWQTMFHEMIPPDKLGRAFSVDYAISFFLMPLAALVAGPLYDSLGIQTLYLGIIIFSLTFQILMLIFSNMRFIGRGRPELTTEIKIEENQNHD